MTVQRLHCVNYSKQGHIVYFYLRTQVSSEQLITDCEVYLLHDFKPELLSLPHFSCYTREEQDKFYVYSETRDTDEHFDFIGEVKMKEL